MEPKECNPGAHRHTGSEPARASGIEKPCSPGPAGTHLTYGVGEKWHWEAPGKEPPLPCCLGSRSNKASQVLSGPSAETLKKLLQLLCLSCRYELTRSRRKKNWFLLLYISYSFFTFVWMYRALLELMCFEELLRVWSSLQLRTCKFNVSTQSSSHSSKKINQKTHIGNTLSLNNRPLLFAIIGTSPPKSPEAWALP